MFADFQADGRWPWADFSQWKMFPSGFGDDRLPRQCVLLVLCPNWLVWSCAWEGQHLSGHSQRTASALASPAVHSGKLAATTSNHHTSRLVSNIHRRLYQFILGILQHKPALSYTQIHPISSSVILPNLSLLALWILWWSSCIKTSCILPLEGKSNRRQPQIILKSPQKVCFYSKESQKTTNVQSEESTFKLVSLL